MLLITHFDKNYFDWFELLQKSIEFTNPDLNLFVYGTNLTSEQLAAIKDTKVGAVHVENKVLDFDGAQERCDGSGTAAMWKIMMQCQVAEAASAGMRLNPFEDDNFIITNADMIFVKPMVHVLEEYANTLNADCLLHFTRDHVRRGQIQNGFIFIKNKPECLEFIEAYDHNIKENVYHFADQKVLLKTFNQFKNKLRCQQLPTQLIDGNFMQQSFVLSAHAGDRNRNKMIFKQILGDSNEIRK